ncbi:MAG: hypothetical protein AAF985_07330, partial [Bacteroidota bacterium]
MNPDCNLLNPLQRDGTSQNQRLVRALHPSSVLVDERDTGQLLLYARDYAELIRYYSLENKPEGNWRIFIECDISTLVAIIANTDLDPIREEFNAMLENIRGESLANKITAYSTLFEPIRQLLVLSDQWCYQAIEGLKLKTACEQLIRSILNDVVKVLIANTLRSVEVGVMATSFQYNFLLSDAWSFNQIQADPTLFPSGAPIDNTEINVAIDRVELAFERCYEALQTIIQQAPQFLEETLNDYPEHEPHMALFLSFLSLFKMAQDHMNTITRKHLNFYYKDVLQLQPLPERPDEVHLILELAKSFQQQLLKKGTAFKAGKDELGVNLFYNSDAEIVINRTKLAEEIGLRSVYIDKDYGTDLPLRDTSYEIKNIYAAPIANSSDGLGEELEEGGKWLTLGGTSMPYAKVGFAIASPIFLLKEAQRDISIDLFFEKPVTWTQEGTDIDDAIAHELRHNIKVYYSGEKEWVEALIESCTLTIPEAGMLQMTFTLHLEAGAAPVVGYDEAVLQAGLNTEHPVFKFVMNNDGLSANYLCFGVEPITAKAQAETVFPEIVQQMILNFFNAPAVADDWAMIAGVEPQDGPIFDNEGIGPIPGYDIGETVARAIINTR